MFEEHRASHYTASWIRWAGGCCMIWMGTFTGCQEDRKDHRKIIEHLLVIYVSIFGISKQCRRSMYLSWLPTLSPPAHRPLALSLSRPRPCDGSWKPGSMRCDCPWDTGCCKSQLKEKPFRGPAWTPGYPRGNPEMFSRHIQALWPADFSHV